jgi:hypothetical protein
MQQLTPFIYLLELGFPFFCVRYFSTQVKVVEPTHESRGLDRQYLPTNAVDIVA